MSKTEVKYVYVIDKHGKPLMPCKPCRAKHLLKANKAVVLHMYPFTIQLTIESSTHTQDIALGVDSGSKHIGLSATTEKKELYSAEVELRTDIKNNLSTRSELRKFRRYRKTRYRKARFDNRVSSKKKGWLAPSIRYKKDKHISCIKHICSLLPITSINVEIANFDIQKIKNSEITGVEYQQGEQYGSYNVREYVLYRDKHTCQLCNGDSGDDILETHHLESRKTGGNAPNNLITLCHTCHDKVHKENIKLSVKRGKSFSDTASVNSFKNQLVVELKEIYSDVKVTFGYITKAKRISKKLNKSHCIDAYCIADNLDAYLLNYMFKYKCVRRHVRSLHEQLYKKGKKRRRTIAPYWLGKDKQFTKYDTVICNNVKCFISGSSNGAAYVKDIDGNKTADVKNTITTKKLKRIQHIKFGMLVDIININKIKTNNV